MPVRSRDGRIDGRCSRFGTIMVASYEVSYCVIVEGARCGDVDREAVISCWKGWRTEEHLVWYVGATHRESLFFTILVVRVCVDGVNCCRGLALVREKMTKNGDLCS